MKHTEFIEKMSGIDPKFVSEAANYRPKRANYIKVIAIAACIATLLTTAAVWGLTLQTENKSTFEILSSVITSEDEAFSLERFNQKEIFADLSRDNLRQIFAAFDVVLAKNDTIEIKDTIYHRELFDNNEIEYTLTDDINLWRLYGIGEEEKVLNHDGKMIINTDQDHDLLKYAMLSSVYMELFPDNWTYGHTAEKIIWNGLSWYGCVYVIPDYAEYGFDNASEAYRSYSGRTEKQFTFNVWFMVIEPQVKKNLDEIMKTTDDPYVLEYFLYTLDQAKIGYENFPMEKKTKNID